MHEITLQFHDAKKAHHLLKQLHSGKGCMVRPEHLGGGWFSGISNGIKTIASNPAVQNIAKDLAKKGLDKGVDYLSNKMAGPSGEGLFGSIGNVLDEVTGKGVKRRPRKRADGSGLFGEIGNVVDAISGEGVKGRKGRQSVKLPKALELYQKYQGGSFSPLG